MKTQIVPMSLLLLVISANSFAVSRVYSGKAIPTHVVTDGCQFIKTGASLIAGLSEAPIVVYINEDDNSVEFTIHGSTRPDSVLYRFVPGDLFSARLITHLTWDENNHYYSYDYQVISMKESKIPIKRFTVRLAFEPLKSDTPEGWGLYRSLGFHTWYDAIMPGDSISGLGFVSSSPPTLLDAHLSGETRVIGGGTDSEGVQALSEFITKHDRVPCLIIAPAAIPEKIEAPVWLNQIKTNLGKLVSNGYLSNERSQQVNSILSDLFYALRESANTTFDRWNPLVNTALDSLTAYQTLIEPEAYAYITENLKYMQRHKDIVWFGKYPKNPR